tara:strand:+ start:146 stop:820 length:675 start_codon:yes stop_codon:yes gene_type:complete
LTSENNSHYYEIGGHMPKQIDKDLLIDSAAEVFAERGYDGAGVAEIARRAGVTTGAIYSRYSGKSELLLEALNRSFAKHMGEILAIALDDANNLNGESSRSPLGPIKYITQNVSSTHDALFLEAVVASSRDAEIATMLAQRLESRAAFIAKNIDDLKDRKRVHASFDTDALKTYVMAMSMGFSVLRSLNYKMPASEEWQKVISQLQTSVSKPPGEKNDINRTKN